MIPPNYKALEKELRNLPRIQCAEAEASGLGICRQIYPDPSAWCAECITHGSADALSLAASLQDEKERISQELDDERKAANHWFQEANRDHNGLVKLQAAYDELYAEKRRLQDEIERLKGYVQHKPNCPKAGVTLAWLNAQGCPSLNGLSDVATAIAAAQKQPCSCGLAPETGEPK
jgi:hypothetical protein